MDYIDPVTVAVYNTAELATAVGVSDYNYVYLAANLTLTAGITIDPNKTSLVLDGFYPLDGTGIQHTFIDQDSTNAANTLGIRTASSIDITLRNMTITGRNYYGVPYVAELTALSGVRVTYENVTYSGPQMLFHPYGTVRFFDCNITIAYPAATDRVQEVAEISRVEMGGRVSIEHTDTGDAVFWFRGNTGAQSFTVLSDAEITINSNSYFMFAAYWNIIYYEPLPVVIDIQPGAHFTLNTAYGISLNSTHQAASVLVDEGATFIYTQRQVNGTNHTLYLNGEFNINAGATVSMVNNFAAAATLVRFATVNAHLNIRNPKRVVFYSGGVAVLSFVQTVNFSLTGGQVNYWLTPVAYNAAGTFEDIPQAKWHKAGYAEPLVMTGTAATAATSVTGHNFTQDELNAQSPLTSLHLYDARVLSIGDVLLDINPVVNDQTPINGTADSNANIRVLYTAEAGSRTLNGTADGAGAFEIATPEILPVDTAVTVMANIPFLIIERTVLSQEAGELTLLSAPGLIRFLLTHVTLDPLLLARETAELVVEVSDTRVYSSDWRLTAVVLGDLTSTSGHTLPDAVVYVDDNGYTPLSDVPVTVFLGEANDGTPKTTYCTWQANRGILVHVTQPIIVNERYTAYMHWEVEPI